MGWFSKVFDRSINEFVNRKIRESYPHTWAECKKCGRVLKSAESLKEHMKMEH